MHLGTPTVFSWAILLTSTLAIGYGIGRTATALDRPVPWVVSGHTPGVAEVTLPLRAQIPLTPTTAIHGSLKSRLQETDNDLMPVSTPLRSPRVVLGTYQATVQTGAQLYCGPSEELGKVPA